MPRSVRSAEEYCLAEGQADAVGQTPQITGGVIGLPQPCTETGVRYLEFDAALVCASQGEGWPGERAACLAAPGPLPASAFSACHLAAGIGLVEVLQQLKDRSVLDKVPAEGLLAS